MASFTDERKQPERKRRRKERSRIDRNALDLCACTIIGDILSWEGGLSLISSHRTSFAWPTRTFSALSSAKWAMAAAVRDDLWGPRSTASHISALVHGFPVRVGQPIFDHSARAGPAGWAGAMPAGHISLRYVRGRDSCRGRTSVPLCVVQNDVGICASWSACRLLLFCSRSLLVSAPVANFPVASNTGG